MSGFAARSDASYSARHPAIAQLMRFFTAGHLPEGPIRDTSMVCAQLAYDMLDAFPDDDPELAVGLRKLLEAKDAFVRCAVASRRGADQ